jgi:hypothetical protein
MKHRTRGAGVASRQLVLLLSAALAVACTPQLGSQPPSLSATSNPTPTAAASLPTPVPTIPPASVAPSMDPLGPSAGLVVRLTTCSDTCGGSVAGTTVLDDGQIIWQEEEGGRVLAAQLTPAGLATARDRIAQLGALSADGNFGAELRPGKEPLPRGTTSYRFDVRRGSGTVVVTSGEPRDFAAEPDLWLIPPEMAALAAFAAQLRNPAAWLGAAAVAVPAHPYVPARYLVLIDLVPGVGRPPDEFAADVDEVGWPFGEPIESVGMPAGPGEDGPPPRCLIVDAKTATATASAESAEGVSRDLRQWSSSRELAWQRADGFVEVTLRQLLPYEPGSCAEIVLAPP